MARGTHDVVEDPRNADIQIWINGELRPRQQAVVSVFDAGFVLGDGVWKASGCTTAARHSSTSTWTGSSRAPPRS